jgi:hypothetical protein
LKRFKLLEKGRELLFNGSYWEDGRLLEIKEKLDFAWGFLELLHF